MRPLRLNVSLLLVLFAAPSFAQSIRTTPKFVEGQLLEFDVSSGRTDQRGDYSSRTPVQAAVASADARGFLLRWTSGETTFQDVPPQVAWLLDAAADAVEGLSLDVQLTPAGEYSSIRNHEQVVAALSDASERMIQAIVSQADAARRGQIEQAMRQAMTPELLLESVTKLVRLYSAVAGLETAPGQEQSFEFEGSSPFGGVIATYLTVTGGEIDAAAREGRISTVSVPTEESLRAATLAMARQLGAGRDAAALEKFAASMNFEMQDRVDYVIDLDNGWPKSVDHRRYVNVGGRRRDEWTKIELRGISMP